MSPGEIFPHNSDDSLQFVYYYQKQRVLNGTSPPPGTSFGTMVNL